MLVQHHFSLGVDGPRLPQGADVVALGVAVRGGPVVDRHHQALAQQLLGLARPDPDLQTRVFK